MNLTNYEANDVERKSIVRRINSKKGFCGQDLVAFTGYPIEKDYCDALFE